MSKRTFSLKTLGAAAILGLGSLVTAAPAQAQSLSNVLDAIRRDSNAMKAEDQARLRDFQAARDEQASGRSPPSSTVTKRSLAHCKHSLKQKRVTLVNCSASSARLLVKRCRSSLIHFPALSMAAALSGSRRLQKRERFQTAPTLMRFQKPFCRK